MSISTHRKNLMFHAHMPTPEEIAEERKRLRLLRIVVDLTAARLYQENLTPTEAVELIARTKRSILQLFPDKEKTFDLIYKPRFERIIEERFPNLDF